jgi:hypothetical protein
MSAADARWISYIGPAAATTPEAGQRYRISAYN